MGAEARGRLAADLDEAVDDLVDAAFVDVEGGDGHEGGADQGCHGEVESGGR